jgi:hypothetical protein
MYNVYSIVPSFDGRDAVSGFSAHVHPYAFLTQYGALAVARMLDRGDDVYTVVVPVGASPFDHRAQIHAQVDAPALDIPF